MYRWWQWKRRREAAEEQALWEEATSYVPTGAWVRWHQAKAAVRDAEDRLRRAGDGEREQAAIDWQNAQRDLDEADEAVRLEQGSASSGSESDADPEEHLEGLIKSLARRNRLTDVFSWLPRPVAVPLVNGICAIVDTVAMLAIRLKSRLLG